MYIDPKYFAINTAHRTIVGEGMEFKDSILSCGFLTKNKSYKTTSFQYEYYVGFYVLNGTGLYTDNDGREYKLYPGCFVQRFPGYRHSTYFDAHSNWLEFFIDFGESTFQNMAQLGLFDSKNPVLHIGESQMLLTELIAYLEHLRTAQVDELPYLLIEAQKILYNINLMSRKSENNALIPLTCKTLRENFLVGTNLKELSQSLGMGYEAFRKRFTNAIGLSPSEYMISERINTAKIMLLDQEMPIKTVASMLGYNDVFAFIKQFKKYTGITPGEFIKR